MIQNLLNTKFKKDISFGYITQAVVILVGFINVYLITKYSGIEVFGQFSILVASVGMLSLLATARTGEAVVKFYKREKIENNLQNAKTFVYYGIFVDIVTAFVFFILVYYLSTVLGIFFLKDESFSQIIILFSIINILFFLRGSMLGYFQANEMFYLFNSLKIMEQILLSLVLLTIFQSIGNTLSDIVYSYIFVNLIIFFIVLLFFSIRFSKEMKGVSLKFKKDTFNEYIKFNFITFLSSSLKAGNQNIDSLILAYFTTPTTVGVYTIIKKVFNPIRIIAIPFQNITYPKLTKMYHKNELERFDRMIKRVTLLLFLIGIAYCVTILLFSNVIIEIFSIDFQNIYSVIYLMMIFSIFLPLFWWHRNFSNIVDPKISLNINFIMTIYQLSISSITTLFYGVEGLIISLIVGNIILMNYFVKRYKLIF